MTLVNQVIIKLFSLMDQAIFTALLDSCLTYLLCAIKETPIPKAEMAKYKESYLYYENLTCICEEGDTDNFVNYTKSFASSYILWFTQIR